MHGPCGEILGFCLVGFCEGLSGACFDFASLREYLGTLYVLKFYHTIHVQRAAAYAALILLVALVDAPSKMTLKIPMICVTLERMSEGLYLRIPIE
ncbi:hypothetical protein DFJ43DRAFT_800736 [Lentinula guzmanii]|uniref:Uncharacterized protein n=1 Tax=Lentinula guzmanii TaxID=2804957 RepID=A0AA38MWN2_9AGAR|nr:hypothetical protein DFJ43DRAFT_800736 [Lentinula guzmanii]